MKVKTTKPAWEMIADLNNVEIPTKAALLFVRIENDFAKKGLLDRKTFGMLKKMHRKYAVIGGVKG